MEVAVRPRGDGEVGRIGRRQARKEGGRKGIGEGFYKVFTSDGKVIDNQNVQ